MKRTLAIILALSGAPAGAAPQGFAFTYQGELRYDSQPVTDQCDAIFSLYDAVFGGNELGAIQPVDGILLADGLFTVELDFGDVYDGEELYLEVAIGAGCGDPAATAETLPRTLLTSVPYANYALTSALADTVDWSNIANRPPGLDDGDDDTPPTVYTAGAGLTLSGNNFELSPTYRLPQGCLDGEIPVWTNGAWICGVDEDRTDFWAIGGNAGTTPGADFIGTLDNQELEFKVNGERALRIEPTVGAPNVIGGSGLNGVVGASGAAIGGGGENLANGDYATIAGGFRNNAARSATVSGGQDNAAIGDYSSVAGGQNNVAAVPHSVIGGGRLNIAGDQSDPALPEICGNLVDDDEDGQTDEPECFSLPLVGLNSYAVVNGGFGNKASAPMSTVGGGEFNHATGGASTVVGGSANLASGRYSTAGGYNAHARLHGQRAYGTAGPISIRGVAQSCDYTLSNVTGDATPKTLLLDGSSAILTLPEDLNMMFDLQVVATVSGSQLYYGYSVSGAAQNDSGTIYLDLGAPTEVGNAPTWDVAVVGNSGTRSLDIVVTGAANTTIRWVATVRATEVIFP